MRRWNTYLTLAILALLLIHAVSGAFMVMGIIQGGSTLLKACSYCMLALVCLHGLVGLWLTFSDYKAKRGTGYAGQNALYWVRRISGLAMVLLIACHLMIFMAGGSGAYRLKLFEGPQLILSLLLVLAVAVHLLCNLRPLLVSLGSERLHKLLLDFILILAIVLLFAAVAFVVYYIRWNLIWRV